MAQTSDPSEDTRTDTGSLTTDLKHDSITIAPSASAVIKNHLGETDSDVDSSDEDSEKNSPVLQTRGKEGAKPQKSGPKKAKKTKKEVTSAASDTVINVEFDKSVKSTLQDLTGHFLNMNMNGVRAEVISPKGPQVVGFKGNAVYVNNDVVCEDVNSLKPQRSYQKRQDGSMWYTNLKVGRPMKQKKIVKFKTRMSEIEKKIKAKGRKSSGLRKRELQSDELYGNPEESTPVIEVLDLKKTREKNGDEDFVLQTRGIDDDSAHVASFSFNNDDRFDFSVSSLQRPSGHFLSLNLEGVRAQAVSPQGPQIVGFNGKKVFVNGKIVCEDTERLSHERNYQKREDGSMWYTNLQVGKEMTPKEIEDFKKERETVHDEMKDDSPVLQTRDSDDDSSNVASFNFKDDNFDYSASSLQNPSGHYLSLNLDGVRTVAISPSISQTVKFIGKKIFVNNRTVCEDTDNLSATPTYQKAEDGSMWYTNLLVGKEMAPEEVEEFKRGKEKIQAEMEENSPVLQTRGSETDNSNVATIKFKDGYLDYSATSLDTQNGNYLSVNLDGVRADMISPWNSQVLGFFGKRVYVNDDIVCKNNEKLKIKRKYQKRKDGSMWFTNLRVGKEMTTKEIKLFNDKKAKIQAEMAKKRTGEEKNAGLQTRSSDDNTSNVASFNFDEDVFDYSAGSLQSPAGHYLNLNLEGIRAEVISPEGPQKVGFTGKKVYLKNKVVCEDIENLSDKRTYQKGEDGSMWYTNLQVGKEMTPQEVEEFKKGKKKVHSEIESNPILQTRSNDDDSSNLTNINFEDINFDYSATSLESPSGHYLRLNMDGVHAEAFSSKDPQVVGFRNNKSVFVNNIVGCADLTNIGAKRTYQISKKDGSMWYTNLQVGTEMTPKQIEEFKKKKQKVLVELATEEDEAPKTGKRETNNGGCWLKRWWSWWY